MNLSLLYKRNFTKIILLAASALLLLLSFVSAIYFRTQPSVALEKMLLQKFIHRQQKDFRQVVQDSVLMRKLVQQNETLDDFKQLGDKDYGIYLFAETLSDPPYQLLFWNNQKILPPHVDFSLHDGEYFQHLANGYYVVEKRTLHLPGLSSNVIAYAMIPVVNSYEVETPYFFEHFTYSKDAVRKIKISTAKTRNPVFSLSGKLLFYIDHIAHLSLHADDTLTIVLRVGAFILLLLFIHFVAESITKRKGILRGAVFLFLVLAVIRTLIFLLPNVFYFRQFSLFDPTIYAANLFNSTLGDLLLNTIFICWLVVFAWFHIGPTKRLPFLLNRSRILVAGIAATVFLTWATFQLADIVRSLVIDSKISFYVTDFFSLDVYTLIGFVILAMVCLTYYYLTRLLLRLIQPAFRKQTILIYFLLAVVGLVFITFQPVRYLALFHLPVLAWLLAYVFILTQRSFLINRFKVTVAGILFWIFIFSISLAVIILYQNKDKEFFLRKSIAEKFHRLTDPSSEMNLKIGLRYIDGRFLVKNLPRFQNADQNRYLRDSIIKENISKGYVNNFNTKIYVFDSANAPINNNDAMSYTELNNIYTFQSKPTSDSDIYYHETSFDQFTYIIKRTIKDTGNVKGNFFIIATPKRYNEDALYPEVLRKINKNDAENSTIYSYAVYNNKRLIASSSKYPFKTDLYNSDLPKSEYETRINGDYDELWYRVNNNKVVVVAKKQDTVLESITLFSYLFCAFLFMTALLRLIGLLLRASSDRRSIRNLWQLNIRSQVHNTIIFISVLSFLIIGAATISFFISRYNRNNVDKLSRTAGIMVKEMQKRQSESDIVGGMTINDDSASNYNLQKLIDDVADIHNVDVNVYDLEGNLLVTSEATVYQSGILSSKMHPEAFFHLNRLRQIQYVQQETMSSLKYLSIYAAVRNEKGDVYAYLNIPYFLSQVDLNQEISNFLVTIINLNAFIFLISGVIALFITNRITRSFSVIGEKMKAIRLGKTNEEIVWNRNDEIGELVKHYNKMVEQLEQSAEALAKSEREGAWREMARQVAHEIKNPLTPMKLSIQYLQKAIVNNQANVKELTANVANTLVEQIDHLSKIAADFARFANIGNKNNELFDLHQVLEGLHALYNANPNVDFVWKPIDEEIMIHADKTQMNRLFSNLLANAVDACHHQEKCRIEVEEDAKDGNVLIQVKDYGEGIPADMQPKIFTPNFTTKTSGTGLGLAMCKSIVEQAGGEIWFTTEPGNGTTFYVSLPLAD